MEDVPVALLKQTLQSIGAEIEEVKTNQKQIITNYLATTGNANTTIEGKCLAMPIDSQSNSASPLPVYDQENLLPVVSLHVDTNSNICASGSDVVGLPGEITKISQQIEELYIKFKLVSDAITKLDETIDNLEQYGRRNCLILHGLRNLPNIHSNYYNFVEYIIGTINHHLNMNLTPQDVDIAHPLRKATNGKTPVIIKFVRRSDRNATYQKKRLLASSGLALTESLTKKRLNLLNEARTLIGEQNVWTFNGMIYCNIDSQKKVIKSQRDLYHLISNLPPY